MTQFKIFGHLSMRVFLLLAAMALFNNCAYYNTMFNAKKSYESGLKKIRQAPDQSRIPSAAKKDFDTTIEKCWKLIEIFSDQNKYADDALLYICKSEFYTGKYILARQHLEQFIAKYPDSDLLAEAHLWYAKAYLKDGEVDQASEHLRYVINNSKRPEIRSEANFELGLYAFENDNYTRSIDYLERALKEKVDEQHRAKLLFYLGQAYFTQDLYEEAITQYKAVDRYRPTLDIEYQSRLNLAKSYTATGKYKESFEILRKMTTAPRFKEFIPSIKKTMGDNYYQQNLLEDAMFTYKEVVDDRKKSPGTAAAAFRLGRIYESTFNNLDSAVVYYSAVEKNYNQYDSIEVARDKVKFLSAYKVIRDKIDQDKKLVYQLKNDAFFRDSLYQAQELDSLKKAGVLVDDPRQTTLDSLGRPIPVDSLQADNNNPIDPNAEETDFNDPFANNANNQQDQADNTGDGNPPSFQDETGNNPSFDGEDADKFRRNDPDSRRRPNRNQNKPKKPEVELRKLPQIEIDLMNNTYDLAEFYLLKAEDYDSAAANYRRFLEVYEDTLLSPRALYSLSYIYRLEEKLNLQRSDSLENVILEQYPTSSYALEIKKSRGLISDDSQQNSEIENARQQYVAAESLQESGNIEQSLQQYQQIADLDSTWEVSVKAQYAIAWIYEHELKDFDRALSAYQKIIDQYPTSGKFVQYARRKTSTQSVAEIFGENTPDLPQPDVDEQPTEEPDEVESDFGVKIVLEDILEQKIRWRIRRNLSRPTQR